MVKFNQPTGKGIDLTPGVRRSEKLKLGLLAAGVLFVGALVLYSMFAAGNLAQEEAGALPSEQVQIPEEVAYRPEVDVARLESLVRDAAGPDRVMLEPEATLELMRSARQMTASSYRDPSIGARELDAATIERVLADPSAERGEPFFARGWIESIEERRAPSGKETRFLGRLTLEDGATAFFLVGEKPESTIFGDFVRVNGLFLKHFSDEDPEAPGTWKDGPLLVGRAMHRSYPSFGAVAELDPYELTGVTDDDIHTGFSGLPFDALWYLLAYAHGSGADAIDWSAAPELRRDQLQDVLNDPDQHRFQPVRIPVSSLMQVTVKRAEENPARLEHFTEGFIGNTTWKSVARFVAPGAHDELELKDLVTARGFFFKNVAYEPRDGGLHVAPMFVLSDLEFYERPSSAAIRNMGYVIGASALVLLVFLSFLLTRDKRSSQQLQERLLRRRRARRGATA
jgi:hypothetical protein